MRGSITGLLTGLAILFHCGSVRAADAADWKVGLAHVKITPEQPIFLWGYGGRNKPFEKVEHDLWAKAMVLEDSEGHRAVIVTTDLLGLPAAISEPICERIEKKTGLKRAQVLINSAHTHTGPFLSLDARERENGMTAGDAERTVEYTRKMQDKIVEVVVQAGKKLEPARLSWGTGVIHFVMNRRVFAPDGVTFGANPRGLADRSVPVLRVDTPEGKLRAVLFGAAVHNTTLRPQHYQICGDYAGFAQLALQEKYPEAQAMFMLGCAGDADPYPHSTMELAREHGNTLAREVGRVLDAKLQPVQGPLKFALAQSDLPLQDPPARAELEKQAASKQRYQAWVAQQMLARLDRGEKLPTTYRCPQAVWQFGTDLTLVGLSGEVVVDYVPLLEKTIGPSRLWVAAYCNDLFGYLPSARILEEGGYETRGLYAGGLGTFTPKAQDELLHTIRQLAVQVGRPMPAVKKP
ncbi:MAG: neutral/alkaline non-lysosomal ceramidase N-terminal domain-containing protein [Gemmataceae bacterium]|nr:neutral/alkaline non-lysosomal ceramidase N-terminal domain-containing protein [Gemmataceae bacterium]